MILKAPIHSDSFIRADLPSMPLGQTGEASTMSVQYYQPFLATNRAVMKATMPPDVGKTITKISVMVYATSASSSGQPINCHRMTDANFMEMAVTWNQRFTGSNWTTAGGDFTLATVNGTLTDSNIASNLGWQEFVVYGTGAVNNITLPQWGETIAFILKAINGTEPTPTAGATCNMGIYSSQYEYPEFRPYLKIEVADDPMQPSVNVEGFNSPVRPAFFKNGIAK